MKGKQDDKDKDDTKSRDENKARPVPERELGRLHMESREHARHISKSHST